MSEAEVERIAKRYNDLQDSGVTVREERRNERQKVMRAFVAKHDLACFKCGSRMNDWAKIGMHKSHHTWAICLSCVRGKPTR